MKIGKRYFVIDDAIFRRQVHVFLNYEDAEFNAWCVKNGADEGDTKADLRNFAGYSTSLTDIKTGICEYVILCRKFNWTIDNMGTLVHEIGHTIVKIWAANHMKINEDTQEFFCHTLGEMYMAIAAKIVGTKRTGGEPLFNKKP